MLTEMPIPTLLKAPCICLGLKRQGRIGRMGEGGIVREVGTNMDTLLYLKWITSKDLLSSTRNAA